MALILGVERGNDFFIGNTQVIVTAIYSPVHFRVTVIEGDDDESQYEVDDKRKVPVMFKKEYSPEVGGMVAKPLVTLQAGTRGSMDLARIAIEAPRTIEVLRGNLYRKTSFGDYELSADALADMKELMPNASTEDVIDMVARAAKITHVKGNKRYEDYVFKMDGKRIEAISAYTPDEVPVGDAPCTGSEKGTILYDDCPECDGTGCGRCDDGLVVIKRV